MRWPQHPPDHVLMLSAERALPAWRERRVERHLTACRDCQRRREVLAAEAAGALLAFTAADGPAHGVATDARLRLERALTAASDAAGPRVGPAHGPLALAAAAAVVAVAIWIAVGGQPGRTRPGAPAAGPLPVAHLTPGAVSDLTAAELCAGARTSRVVPDRVRRQVLAAYGMERVPADTYELDALITRELGGTAELANLWPQPYHAPVWNARVKDALEAFLARQVCGGSLPLREAQHAIASDWVGAYRHYFRTDTPLHAHVSAREVDDDLIVEQGRQVRLVTPFLQRMARGL
ncbi:MAG: hypothetical protein AB7I25_07155 [Vicinamibacterales bacterium]